MAMKESYCTGLLLFSPIHQTFSQIDYFLVDSRLLTLAETCIYNAIVISDPSPFTATFRFAHYTPRPRMRLSIIALPQEECVQFVEELLLEKILFDNLSYTQAEKILGFSTGQFSSGPSTHIMNLLKKPAGFLPTCSDRQLPLQLITKIQTPEGCTYDNQTINNMFKDFYGSL